MNVITGDLNLFEAINSPLLHLDEQGHLLAVNPCAGALLAEHDLTLGHPLWHYAWFDGEPPSQPQAWLSLAEQQNRVRFETRHHSGHWAWTLQTLPNGHYLAQGHDVGPQQRLEQQLQYQAYWQETRSDMTGLIAGGLAHDFNNLLTILIGNLKFIESRFEDDEDTLELIEDAVSACRDGIGLIRTLLSFSNKTVEESIVVQPNDWLQHYRYLIQRATAGRIEFEVNIERNLPEIRVEQAQLERALISVLILAWQETGHEGRLCLSARRDRNDIRLAVEFPPVAERDMQNLLDQADYIARAEARSTGLGIGVVPAFCQRMGGRFAVEVAEETDTTVCSLAMYLPTHRAKPVTGGSTAVERVRSINQLPRGSASILVVEDDAGVRRFALRSLNQLGYKTLEAENADIAYEMVCHQPHDIDLVFSDIIMPGQLNGYSFGNWLVENHPKIQIVLATGFSQQVLDAQARGINHPFTIMRKPYTLEQLALQIHQAIQSD